MEKALQRLLDKDEIRDLMARYARGVDRADWDVGVRSTYHEDAYDDHGDYKGDVDGFIAFGKDRLGDIPQAVHFLGQSLIEFASDTVAVVETYFCTMHTLGPEAKVKYGAADQKGPVQLSHIGRYVDRVEKRKGEWRIAHRICVFEATRLCLDDVPPIKPDWAHHHRSPEDPIFKVRKEAGL
ncbi:MAG: nuclear transport factor 2 family protein [Pseudomonadota bacterium]